MSTLTKEQIVEAVGSMSLLEVADLVKMFEDKFGVSAAAPVAAVAVAGGGAPAEAAEEQTEFDVILESAGDKKINVLKVVRELTGLGLKEAKEIVDGAPKTIKEKIKKEDAQAMKAKLEAEGAKVSIK
ncbi:MAG: 50S ribosomal protein L7/L12 [Candidatus Sericytochromatia bacterium]